MKQGKVSDSVLKRSVLKKLKTNREEVIFGAALGEDCAVLSFKEEEAYVTGTDSVTCMGKASGAVAVCVAANDLAASGAEPIAVLVSALFPGSISEEDIKETMTEIEEQCSILHMQVAGGHTEVTSAVTRPVLTVTGIGKTKEPVFTKGALPGQDVVVSKWIGLEGSYILAKEKEKELLTRYPVTVTDTALSFLQYLPVVHEAATAMKSGVRVMHDVSEGGIFSALWQLAECSGVGLEIDLKQIPVKQETVEICEFFGLNPYEIASAGALLMVTDNGADLVKALAKENISAAVIGKITDGNDRVVINEDERRFLEPSRADELYKMFQERK